MMASRESARKRWLIGLLAVGVLVLATIRCGLLDAILGRTHTTTEQVLSETPQEKVEDYLAAVRRGDREAALALWPANEKLGDYEESRRQEVTNQLLAMGSTLSYRVVGIEWWRNCCEPGLAQDPASAGVARMTVEIARQGGQSRLYVLDVITTEAYWGEAGGNPIRRWVLRDVYPYDSGPRVFPWRLPTLTSTPVPSPAYPLPPLATPTHGPYPPPPSTSTSPEPAWTPGPSPTCTLLPTRTAIPTWPVIVPATATPPQPTTTALPVQTTPPAKVATPATQETLSPAQFQQVQHLLFPNGLPAMTCEGNMPTGRMEILAVERAQWSPEETAVLLVTYLLKAQRAVDFGLVDGDVGLALFSPGYQTLVWKSPLASSFSLAEMMGEVQSSVSSLSLGLGQKGLLWHLVWVDTGSGASRWRETRLYRQTDEQFVESWKRMTREGGRMGWCCSSSMNEDVALEDVDGDGQAEVLLSHTESKEELEFEYRAVNYTLYLPGALGWRWDGTSYVPAYWLDEGRVTAVRPRLPVHFAPRLSHPLTIDGSTSDWGQVEYGQIEYQEALVLNPDKILPHLKATAAWDDQRFYLTTEVSPGEIVTLSLDTNLAGDLDDATLNADDVVLEVAVPALTGCQCPLKVRFLHPSQDAGSVRVAAAPTRDGSAWTLELSIPFEALGLTGRNLVPERGWVAGGLNPTDYREYHPRAGWVMGLAVAVDSYASSATARLNDPTTWDTLVLMADR